MPRFRNGATTGNRPAADAESGGQLSGFRLFPTGFGQQKVSPEDIAPGSASQRGIAAILAIFFHGAARRTQNFDLPVYHRRRLAGSAQGIG